MSEAIESKNKALVLEAFNTLFNKRDYAAAGKFWSPHYTRHVGYPISPQKRKRVEQSFGWMKTIGLLRKVKLRGIRKVSGWFTFVGAAYNLIRLRRLQAEAVA